MRTFWIQTLGCKVNQYESEQIATLLRGRGLRASDSPREADLHVINTCSVTIQAASKSRQTVRRTYRLEVLETVSPAENISGIETPAGKRTIVTGCWATSNANEAANLPGVDAVLGHHEDVADQLNRLLDQWCSSRTADDLQPHIRPEFTLKRKENTPKMVGTHRLPLLGEHQTGHQRAFLKVQDGCDAHCTYCIIPQLRPSLWSKPVEDTINEARQLVDVGHREIVLTGIFLGAYGQPTALRRRQAQAGELGPLVNALCTQVSGLKRLRFSSLEPGDLTPDLIRELSSYPQVVPHFHLPLQSGSDQILRRMNRQYTRDDFLRMIDQVNAAFDRPAITTDIIVGFPGETDAEFDRTLEVVEQSRFIHIHAFSFSPRPGTAAARWTDDFVHGPIVNERINRLAARAIAHSHQFRKQFLNETVELLVERPDSDDSLRHGRSERYFDVWFEDAAAREGDAVRVRIDRVTPQRTWGQRLD